jgi:hypothetical protein
LSGFVLPTIIPYLYNISMLTAPNKTLSRSTNSILSIITVAAFLFSPSALGIFGDLFKNDLNVIINTDITEAGKKAGLPSPNNPVYIDGVFYGFNNLGTAYGQQKEPLAENMVSGIFKELHKQGYIFTTHDHQPTQLITIHWGTMRSTGSGRGASPQWLYFLGGDKLGLEYELVPFGTMDPGLARRGMRSGKDEAIVQAAKKDLYYIQIAAYEFNSAVEGGQSHKILGNTHCYRCPREIYCRSTSYHG